MGSHSWGTAQAAPPGAQQEFQLLCTTAGRDLLGTPAEGWSGFLRSRCGKLSGGFLRNMWKGAEVWLWEAVLGMLELSSPAFFHSALRCP